MWNKKNSKWWYLPLKATKSRWIAVWTESCKWGIYDHSDDLEEVASGIGDTVKDACADAMAAATGLGFEPA